MVSEVRVLKSYPFTKMKPTEKQEKVEILANPYTTLPEARGIRVAG